MQSIHDRIDDGLFFERLHLFGDLRTGISFISHLYGFFDQKTLSAGTGQGIDDVDPFITDHVFYGHRRLIIAGKPGRQRQIDDLIAVFLCVFK